MGPLVDSSRPAGAAGTAGSSWQGQLYIENLCADWQGICHEFFTSPVGLRLQSFLQARLKNQAVIYPPQPLKALELTALADVRVLILGQDPYHGPGQAQGLAFSVAQGIPIAPSLRNIFKERQRDMQLAPAAHGSLVTWAKQGILLLNTTLTVERGQPASHAQRGWEQLTDRLITACAARDKPTAFLLWGAHAQAKRALIAAHTPATPHLILTANHPSPLSALRPPAPFIGCGHFGKTARFFEQLEGRPTDLFLL